MGLHRQKTELTPELRTYLASFFKDWSKYIYREAYRCCMRDYEDVAGNVIENITRTVSIQGRPLKEGSERWYIKRAVQLESLRLFNEREEEVLVEGYDDGCKEDVLQLTVTAPESDGWKDFDKDDYDLMRFEEIIANCSEHQKKILRMRFVYDLTPKEIYEKTGYEQRKTSEVCRYAKKHIKF